KNKLSEEQLLDFVLEYIENPELIRYLTEMKDQNDGSEQYSQWSSFIALWSLLAKLPVGPASYAMVMKLPVSCPSAFGEEVPEDILSLLDKGLLKALLDREDVIISKYGKEKLRLAKLSKSAMSF